MLAASALTAGSAAAQEEEDTVVRHRWWRAELAAGLGARYLESTNDLRVESRVLPLVGGGIVWPTGANTSIALTTRLSFGPLRISDQGNDWSGGNVLLADVLGTGEWYVRPSAGVHVGVGMSWVRGPSDVAPFSFNNGTPLHLGGLAGVSAVLPGTPSLRAFLDVHGFHYGSATVSDPIKTDGTVLRYVLGVRYGR